MNTRLLLIAAMLVAIAITAVVAYTLGARAREPIAPEVRAASAEPSVLYWYDPMVPDQHFDKPGKSPFMDMDLVPKYAGADDAATVRIAASTTQNLGLRTAPVDVGRLETQVRVPGSVAWNLRESTEISARADGIVERLSVRAPFEQVRAGQVLAGFIAPAWNAAAQEYLALEHLASADAQALREAARQRLRVLGMDDAQIRRLGDSAGQVQLRAPRDGVVSALTVREGQRVQAGTSLMTINGLDTVWVEAAIPQAQIAGVGVGTPVTARSDAIPGEDFSGTVESLIADIDARTRTQVARVVIDNPGHRLVPGQYVELDIHGAPSAPLPLVPDSALIATGTDARVILDDGQGGFQPVRVRTGRSAGGMTEILDGLSGGERVVVSGQFLLDSEASLSGVLDRLGTDATGTDAGRQNSGGNGASGHDMQGHDMQGHDMQGHDMQGHDMQGHDMQGHDMQGHDMQGHDMHAPPDKDPEP